MKGHLKGTRPPGRGKGNPWLSSPQQRGVLRAGRAGPGATYLGVDNFVSAQRTGLAEAFAADFAHERSGSGVDRHVAGEVIVSVKHLWKDTRGPCVCLSESVESACGGHSLPCPTNTPLQKTEPFSFCKGLSNPQLIQSCVATDNGIPILQNRKLRPRG